MSLEQAYFVSGIVAAIGVVISLVYLAAQVRQNTRSVQMHTGHAVSEALGTLYRYSTGDVSGDVMYRGFRGTASLKGSDRLRFYAMMHDYFFAFQNAYFQMMAGTLDARYWSSALNALKHIGSFPGVRTYWAERGYYYSDDFRAFLDREVFSGNDQPRYHLAGEFFDGSPADTE